MVGIMDTPIACTLPVDQFRTRTGELAALGSRALRSREPIEHGERLGFAADDTTERDLRAAIAAEAECCAFLSMDLRRDDDRLLLDITGPDEARPIIEQMFA